MVVQRARAQDEKRKGMGWDTVKAVESFLCSILIEKMWLRLRDFGCVLFSVSILASYGRFTARRWILIARLRFLVLKNLAHHKERHWLPIRAISPMAALMASSNVK